jgi:quinol monooxygenase YgiN
MTHPREPLPPFFEGPSTLGPQISLTGKWIPTKPGGLFRKSAESKAMRQAWEDIRADAQGVPGVRSTEINEGVDQDAVLVHQIFSDSDAFTRYLSAPPAEAMAALTKVAKPQIHLVRGVGVPAKAREALSVTNVPYVFGEYLFGYERESGEGPDPGPAIEVTAKWTCKPGAASHLEDLKYWWQRVGTDAFSSEEGLLGFEVYQVVGEDALIIHETFRDNAELRFHLSKGTAAKYKKDIDKIATPECYFFRGPVSWMIRTYSKFMRLPATYSR